MQRVFVVEDSALLRDRLVRMLNTLPGTVVSGEATSADEAIAAICRERPDVVLVDVYLERSSGFEVLSALAGRLPGTDFYMLSNRSSEPYRRHAERLGARGFFDKSSELERVREVIERRAAVH
jgi:two-component system OmpR family response regulator